MGDTDGLKDGDKVIVEGISIAAMSGAKQVTPKEWTPPASAAAATPAVQTARLHPRPSLKLKLHLKPNKERVNV